MSGLALQAAFCMNWPNCLLLPNPLRIFLKIQIRDHVDNEDNGVTKRDTIGGTQKLTFINESGHYGLILRETICSHVDEEDKTTVAICDTGFNYKSGLYGLILSTNPSQPCGSRGLAR